MLGRQLCWSSPRCWDGGSAGRMTQLGCRAEGGRGSGAAASWLAGTEGALLGLVCPLGGACVFVQRGGDPKSWGQAVHHFGWERQP